MKRFLALIAVAGLAVGLYAAAAPGGQQSVTPAQFAALKTQVTKLQKDMKSVKSTLACFVPVGIVEFGDGTTTGYHFKQTDGTEILTSALDAAGQGETPDAYFLAVDSKCVSSLRFARAHFGSLHSSH